MILNFFKNIKSEVNDTVSMLKNTDVFNGNIVNSSIDKSVLSGLNMGYSPDGQMTSGYADAIKILASSYNAATAEANALKMAQDGLSKSTTRDILVQKGYNDEQIRGAINSKAFKDAQTASTVAMNADTTATMKNIVATKALTVAKKALSTVAGMVAGALLSIVATAIISFVSDLIDKVFTTTEEYKELLDETKNDLESITSELKSLNDELETTKSRIAEIQSKGSLSFSEKEEYDNLVRQNNELQRKIALLEQEEKFKNKELNKTFVKTMDRDFADNEYYKDESGNVYYGSANEANTTATTEYYDASNEKEYIQYQFAERKRLLDELSKAETKEQQERIQKQIDQIELYLSNKSTEFSTLSNGISYIENPTTEDEKATNAWLDYIADFQDKMMIEFGTDNAKINAFNRIVDSSQFDGTVQLLQDLGKEGKVTADMLNNPAYDAFIDKLVEIGVIDSADNLNDIADAFNNVANEAKNATGALSGIYSKEKMISDLNDMSEGFEELDKIYTSVKDDDPFDFKLLDDKNFKETFSGLEGYADFFETITSNADNIDACQSAFNNLVSEWIASEGILNNVTEENEKLTASMLEQMGVVNASDIVSDVLKRQESATKILESAEIDLINATAAEIYSLNGLEEELAQSGAAVYDVYLKKKLCSENPVDTSADCNALIAMAEQCKVTGETLALLIKLKNTYLTLESDMWGDATKKIAAEEAEKLKAQLANTSVSANIKPVVSYTAPSTGKTSSSSSKDTEESFDWIQVKIERLEREISNLDKIVNATYKSWTDRNKALVNEMSKVTDEITVQEAGYNKYMSLANGVGLSDKYKKLVQSGAIDYSTIKDEGLIDKIKKYQEFYELALGCKDAIVDLQDELASLAKLSFDNVVSQYEDKLSSIEHDASVLNAYIDQAEAKGHVVSKSYYEQLMKTEQMNNKTLRSEYASLQAALKKAMADGSIKEGSSDWYEMMGQINGVELAIIESNTALVEFQNNIRDLEWENFDRLEDMISQITEEANFLIDLMSDEDLFDDKGNVTDQGKATFGLHAVNYDTYMEQARDYADEISEIDKDLAEDPYNVDLLERREELLQSQRDMILAAEDEKKAMIDLAEEGYNKMLDYLDELINKRKEALQAEKDIFDYEKNIREQTEEIARLEKIGQALSGDTSEEGQLRAQQNAKELKEAREALQETEYEKYLSDQEQMLDTLYSDAEQWVDERLRNTEELISGIIEATNTNSETIKTTLETETRNVGIKLSDEMNSIWSSGGSANNVVSTYSQGISDSITSVITVLERIETFVESMVEESDKEADEDIDGTSNNSPTGNPSGGSGNSGGGGGGSNTTPNNPSNDSSDKNSNWGSWFISKKNSVSKSKLNKDTSIVDRLKYLDYDSSFSARAKYYKAMGGSGTYTGTATQNKWMISEMKKNGFHSGGLIGSAIKASGEDGFVLAKAGEYILTADQFDKLSQALVNAQPFINAFDNLPRIDLNSAGNTITNEIEMNIAMHGVQDVQGLVSELQRDNRFQKIVEQMTIGRVAGGNSLSKYKYK